MRGPRQPGPSFLPLYARSMYVHCTGRSGEGLPYLDHSILFFFSSSTSSSPRLLFSLSPPLHSSSPLDLWGQDSLHNGHLIANFKPSFFSYSYEWSPRTLRCRLCHLSSRRQSLDTCIILSGWDVHLVHALAVRTNLCTHGPSFIPGVVRLLLTIIMVLSRLATWSLLRLLTLFWSSTRHPKLTLFEKKGKLSAQHS